MVEKDAKKKLKLKILLLEVANKNKIAFYVYKKMGFKKLDKIKKGFKHFGKYIDYIIMVKYLQ